MDETKLAGLGDTAIGLVTMYGIRVLGAVVILIVGRIAAGLFRRIVSRAMRRSGIDEAVTRFVVSLAGTGVMLLAVIAALNKFGVQTTSFVAVLGAAGLAVGLALQGSLSNFAAGVLILVFKPFKLGDFIAAAGEKGKVTDIGIFTTTLTTPDNQKIIIPNASITSGSITNVNAYDTRRVDLVASISYGDDIAKAKEVLTRIVTSHEKVLKDPVPAIEVTQLADSSVNFVVRPWVNTPDYWPVYFDVTRAIKEEFDKAGISIPFPQRDVHVHQIAGR